MDDWLAPVLATVLAVVLLWWSIERRRLTDEMRKLHRAQLATQGMLQARQSHIKYDRTFQQAPGVDAQARTSRPTRDDIPKLGGAHRPLKMKRVGGDTDA